MVRYPSIEKSSQNIAKVHRTEQSTLMKSDFKQDLDLGKVHLAL